MEFDFEENAAVESLDKVPEKYHGLYEQTSEGYQISESVKPLVEAYTGTTKSLDTERGAKKKANDEAKDRRLKLSEVQSVAEEFGVELDDDSSLSEALRQTLNDFQTKAKNGEEVKLDVEKVKESMKKQHDEQVNAKDQEISARDSAIQKMMVSSTASSELVKAGDEGAVLMPHIQSMCKVVQDGEDNDGVPNYEVRVLDAEGDFRTDGKGGYMGVAELVEEMKTQEKFAPVFKSDTPGGTGGKPGPGTRRPANKDDMSSNDKIAAGLSGRSGSSQTRFGVGT